uniref:Protein farnesyltransferase subunit beta n=1 Tax=Panagrellus redivivus TaxID=6233 RepID=A0A7E4VXI3_PANRE
MKHCTHRPPIRSHHANPLAFIENNFLQTLFTLFQAFRRPVIMVDPRIIDPVYDFLDEDTGYCYLGFKFQLCHYGFAVLDKIQCETTHDQVVTEEGCMDVFEEIPDDQKGVLMREKHARYLRKFLHGLNHNFISLEGSRAWIVFWCVNGLRILKQNIEKDLQTKIITFLKTCQKETGGFGGSPSHLAHLATTYASVMSLVSLGTDEALEVIDRNTLYDFILSMKQPNGSFIMHEGGEADIRGVYCAVAVAEMTGITDEKLFEGTAAWVVSCQTYEGGFAAEPFVEAHGGYTYCGVAALAMLHKLTMCNYDRLLLWSSNRQMGFEGGFQGRANKLVDACYSFWMAAIFPILDYELQQIDKNRFDMGCIFDSEALEHYLLTLCQDRERGGIRDKPGKTPDAYHTCYGLAGLSIAQHYSIKERETIVGGEDNLLASVNPLYNVVGYYHELAASYYAEYPFERTLSQPDESTYQAVSDQDKGTESSVYEEPSLAEDPPKSSPAKKEGSDPIYDEPSDQAAGDNKPNQDEQMKSLSLADQGRGQ